MIIMAYITKANAKKIVDSWYKKWVDECSTMLRTERPCFGCEHNRFKSFVSEDQSLIRIGDCEMLRSLFKE